MKSTKILLLFFLLVIPLSVSAALTNPLGTTDLRVVIGNLIQAMLGITGSLALLMFIWGGFQWLFSAGEKGRVEKGKETIKWATLGLALIFAAYVLVKTLVSALESGSVL